MSDDKLTMFIAVGAHGWGSGKTEDEAIAKCRVHATSPDSCYAPKRGTAIKCKVWKAHEDSSVDGINGGISYPKDHPPEDMGERILYWNGSDERFEHFDELEERAEALLKTLRDAREMNDGRYAEYVSIDAEELAAVINKIL